MCVVDRLGETYLLDLVILAQSNLQPTSNIQVLRTAA